MIKKAIKTGTLAVMTVAVLSSCSNAMKMDTLTGQKELNNSNIRTIEIKNPSFKYFTLFSTQISPERKYTHKEWYGYEFDEYPDRVFFFPKQGEGLCMSGSSVIYVQKYSSESFSKFNCSGLNAREDGKPKKIERTEGNDDVTYVTRQIYPLKEKVELYGYFCYPGETKKRTYTFSTTARVYTYTIEENYVKNCTRGIVRIMPSEN